MNKYKYCPACKADLIKTDEKAECKNCGFVYFFNPSPCVTALPVKDGRLLMSLRGIEPFKGQLDVIGGFAKPDENLEETAIRETKEETGLDIKIVKYLSSYPDYYGDKDKPIVVINYVVEIIGGSESPGDDVAELMWVPINDLPNLKIEGFEKVNIALNDLYNFVKGSPIK